MSAVARILQESGWRVTGSDEGFYPPIADVIRRYEIPCAVGYSTENLPESLDKIVIGMNAKLVPETNPEVAAAYATGKKVSFPGILHELTAGCENYVVAGSFGKSSCSAIAAWVLEHAGKRPGWFVGAEALNLPDNGRLGNGKLWVLEGDEYPACHWDKRSKFLFYNARHVLLTSGAHDHFNVFPTVEDYLAPFETLVSQLPGDGTLVACWNGENLARVADRSNARVVWYSGEESSADWWADDISLENGTTHFAVRRHGTPICHLQTTLLGRHNVENLVGVAALLLETGVITPQEIEAAIREFRGVRRRLERLTSDSAIPVFNDFGSSFPKCRAGIDAVLAGFPDKNLTVVFEPHTFSFRNRAALPWYDALFQGVDRVLVLPPPDQGKDSHEQISHAEIVARIRASGVDADAISTREDLLSAVSEGAKIVLIESSGGVLGAVPELAAWGEAQKA